MALLQQGEPSSVEENGENKVPANTVDSRLMGRFKPLVNDETAKQKVDDSPDVGDPES